MTVAIDLFAGAGGFTAGAELAGGVDVVWAANHWREAVEVHSSNHPNTEHSIQDLMQADWQQVPDHDLLLASPACQGHSTAGQPGRARAAARHESDRNTAWAVIGCAEARRPRTIIVENVPAFLRWPLLPAWSFALRTLGYVVTSQVLDSADFGVPQNRKRLIITARLGEALPLYSPAMDWRGFGECIDWSIEEGWKPVASKKPGVIKRVEAGRARGLGDRFLSHYAWSGHKGRELERPIATITTKDQWAIVDGDRMRMLRTSEYAAGMGFPSNYKLAPTKAESVRMLGNAVCPPMAAGIICQATAN